VLKSQLTWSSVYSPYSYVITYANIEAKSTSICLVSLLSNDVIIEPRVPAAGHSSRSNDLLDPYFISLQSSIAADKLPDLPLVFYPLHGQER